MNNHSQMGFRLQSSSTCTSKRITRQETSHLRLQRLLLLRCTHPGFVSSGAPWKYRLQKVLINLFILTDSLRGRMSSQRPHY